MTTTGKYVKQPDGQFIWVGAGEEVYLPPGAQTASGEHTCWRFKQYIGFTHVYDYCEDCGKPKPEGYGRI